MHRGKPALPSDDLPLWLSDLLRITDRKKFKRAVLSEVLPRWDALRPRKRRGPPSLPAFDVYDATATVLEALTPCKCDPLEF